MAVLFYLFRNCSIEKKTYKCAIDVFNESLHDGWRINNSARLDGNMADCLCFALKSMIVFQYCLSSDYLGISGDAFVFSRIGSKKMFDEKSSHSEFVAARDSKQQEHVCGLFK